MTFLEFVESQDESRGALIDYLNQLILDIPNVTRKMRYKIPFYDHHKWFCYINPVNKDLVELCFLQGKEMNSKFPILNMRKRKMISGIYLNMNEDVPIDLITDMLQYAIELTKSSK